MYPYFRLIKVLVLAKLGRGYSFDDIGELKLRVWPGDIDVYPEMNNGRQLTLMDLGRIDFALRTGLMSVAHHRHWGFAVAGSSVRYRHKLPPLSRFAMRTRLLGHDGRWLYFHQQIVCRDQVCTSALIRLGLVSKKGLVLAKTALAALDRADWQPEMPEWVRAWAEADELRPDA